MSLIESMFFFFFFLRILQTQTFCSYCFSTRHTLIKARLKYFLPYHEFQSCPIFFVVLQAFILLLEERKKFKILIQLSAINQLQLFLSDYVETLQNHLACMANFFKEAKNSSPRAEKSGNEKVKSSNNKKLSFIAETVLNKEKHGLCFSTNIIRNDYGNYGWWKMSIFVCLIVQ